MSERRMFAKTILLSDAYLDLPHSSRSLYVTLAMFADDDGFVNSPKNIMRLAGATPDDLDLLTTKKFIILFDSGIAVIKHWNIHNYIRRDRKKDTNYPEEKSLLAEKANGAYTLKSNVSQVTDKCQSSDGQMSVKCQSNVSQLPDKCPRRIGEANLNQDNLGEEERADAHVHAKADTKHLHGGYNNVKLTDKELDTLYATYGKEDSDEAINYLSEYIKLKGYKAQSHYLAIRKWVFDALKEDRIKKAELEAREKRVQPHTDTHSTFDSDEFLNAAVNRTFGDNY